jgi:hypothetical protein
MPVLEVSARTGKGMSAWIDALSRRRAARDRTSNALAEAGSVP